MANSADHVLDELEEIDFFTSVGESLDTPWAVAKCSTWRSALMDWFDDLAGVKIIEMQQRKAWCDDNLDEGCEYLVSESTRLSERVQRLALKIAWPKIPRSSRILGDSNERYMFKSRIIGDFEYIALEASLIAMGRPPSVFSDIYKAYQMGHFPCGYEGTPPSGRLIVF